MKESHFFHGNGSYDNGKRDKIGHYYHNVAFVFESLKTVVSIFLTRNDAFDTYNKKNQTSTNNVK